MKAIINCGWQHDGMVVEGKTLNEIKRKLDQLLDVGGPRGLSADVETGAKVQTSLYAGQDRIWNAAGRLIYSNEIA